MGNICEFMQVTKWFPPGQLVFEKVDLTILAGEKMLITGYAGSGRTTLLQLAAGIVEPDEGEVKLSGSVAIVPEYTEWLESLSLTEHLALPLMGQGMSRRESLCRGKEMLTVLGLEGRGNARPGQMSFYEKAMTGLGQALLQESQMIAVDTLTAGLTQPEKDQWMTVLIEKLEGRALLVMSDHAEYENYFDRILEIENLGNEIHPYCR